ncbi:MAG: hypothetical protein AB7P40_26250, partial [Chloroflexota bacterium]
MQPTTYTFAPRVPRSAPTAPSGAAQSERPSNENSRQNRRRTETAPDRQTDQDSNRQRSARDRQPTSGERQRPDA